MIDAQQQLELTRVAQRISHLVMSWCRDRYQHAPQFHLTELSTWVARHAPLAPGSPDRILRDLRKRNRLGYRVLQRNASLYELTFVTGDNQ